MKCRIWILILLQQQQLLLLLLIIMIIIIIVIRRRRWRRKGSNAQIKKLSLEHSRIPFQSDQYLSCICTATSENASITKTRLFKWIENFITKNWRFSDKNSDIFFHISAQNIDCGYSLEQPQRGGSNEYLQSMFLGRNKKNNVYPCKPQFYYIKVGYKGVKII